MYMAQAAAEVVSANLSTSEKIRRLQQQGIRQADIARLLGIRDQFVSNVVRAAARKGSPTTPAQRGDPGAVVLQARTQIAEGGRVVIPAAMRTALGLGVGDDVLLRLEGGQLRLLTPRQALAYAQDLVRAHAGAASSLANELIAERRHDAARE